MNADDRVVRPDACGRPARSLSQRERGRGEGTGGAGVTHMTSEPHEFARTLRKHMTPAEDILWRRLRGSRFHGAKFRRQVPFDRYVADFYCHAAKLVVELDGKQHDWFVDYDDGRTEVIENFGVRVLRFTNAEVCNDPVLWRKRHKKSTGRDPTF